MQRAYKPLPTVPGRPPAVQRVAYPDGVPIAEVAERMGWFVEPPPEFDVFDASGVKLQDAYRPDVTEPVTAEPTTAEPIRSPKAAPAAKPKPKRGTRQTKKERE